VRLTPAFAAIVPYAPRVPLETWILPRSTGALSRRRSRRRISATSRGSSPSISARSREGSATPDTRWCCTPRPSPVAHPARDWATIRDDYHWHIEIIPEPEHANRIGGIFVNETRPEVSALSYVSLGRSELGGPGLSVPEGGAHSIAEVGRSPGLEGRLPRPSSVC